MHPELQKLSSSIDLDTRQWVQNYLGSNKPTKCIKSAAIHSIAKAELKKITSSNELYKFIDEIYENATTYEEMALAASIFTKGNRFHDSSVITWLDKWLNKTVGWAEVDSLCQSSISPKSIIKNWKMWRTQLIKFSFDKNIHKRRASVVLLCKSLRESPDSRFYDLALSLVESLKHEQEILITKAISWVLRCLVNHHPEELATYLEENKDSLPRIAYRESIRKLNTGKKN